jgi:DHA1 family inner membrane transport protein
LLLALSAGALLASATTIGITPFLLDIARDLRTDLAAAGNLVALQSVSWGIASVFAGAASDRWGRRLILVGGQLLLAISGIAVVFADSYPAVAAWRVLGGFGGGAYMGAVFATVADHVPMARRGRSLGWVVTGQSLALVLGVPAMTLIGAAVGWRGAVLAHACVVLLGALVIVLVVPHGQHLARQAPLSARATLQLVGPRVLTLLLSGSAERVCYSALAVFLPTFLLTRFLVDPTTLALGLGVVAIGNFVGNIVGGQLTDRVRVPQLVVACSLTLAGAIALPLLMWSPAAVASIVLGFGYTLLNATSRPALLTLLSHVSVEARGAVMGLNITFASLGWIAATLFGGFVESVSGFGGLGVLVCCCGACGAALALLHWRWPTFGGAEMPALAGEG